MLDAVGRHDRARADLVDPLGDHRNVRLHQRRVPVAGGQDAPAAGRVVGNERFGGEVARFDHRLEQLGEHPLEVGAEPAVLLEQREPGLVAPVDPLAIGALQEGQVRERQLLEPVEGAVALGTDVVRAALEERELTSLTRDAGNELDRAGSDADDADPFTPEVVVVIPAGRVEGGSLELAEAGDVRNVGPVQLSEPAHHDVRLVTITDGRRERPPAGLLGPGHLGDLGLEPQVRTQFEPGHQRLEVVEDLGLFGELPGPVGLGREREAVEVRRDVAPRARIAVVPPGSPHPVGLLEEGEGVASGEFELDRHRQPTRAPTDDRHLRRRCAAGERITQAVTRITTATVVPVNGFAGGNASPERHVNLRTVRLRDRAPDSRRGRA